MKEFLQIGTWDIVPLLLQLDRNPGLWDANNDRTTRAVTAHRATSDIWLRFRPLDQLVGPESYNEPFVDMCWYPAYHVLTEIRPIVQALMVRVSATSVGTCLITRIPAGQQVLPHNDSPSWNARTFDTKVYIPLRANARCVNYCADESMVMGVGQAWVFSNLKTHSVVNDGDEERVTLICSFKCD